MNNLKIFILLLPAFLISQVISFAADTINVDSIRQQISLLPDSARVYRLTGLSDELKYSNTGKALELAYLGLEISVNSHLDYETGISHQCIAEIYRVRALYERSLEHYLAALKIFTMLKDNTKIAECSNETGSIFMLSGNYAQASIYFIKALEINRNLRNIDKIAANYTNIGRSYVMQDSIDKGLSYYLVALMIADSLKKNDEIINLLNNIGSGYIKLEKYPEAMSCLEKAAKKSVKQDNRFAQAQAYLGISQIYYKTNYYSRALKFGLNSLDLAKSGNFNSIMHDAELLLSEIYASTGRYKNAYNHYINYKILSDSIFNDRSAKQLAVMQARYEVEAKEKENQMLRLLNEENRKTIKRKNTQVTITFLLILVSVVFVLMLLIINKRFKKLNQKLADQSEELKKLNLEKDRFFAYVVHNIKNPFTTIWGFSELMMKHAGTKDTEKMVRYSKYIYDSSLGIKEILENLLEWSRLMRGKIEYKPGKLELEGLIKDVIELNNKAAAKNNITLSYENTGDRYVFADRQMVYTILQNLISNGIKYNVAGGKVVVSAASGGSTVKITVADTGEGIPSDKLNKLFVFDPSDTAPRDEKSASAGMGLVICRELVSRNGGEIYVESTPGKGSRFTFTLPVPGPGNDTDSAGIAKQMAGIKDELRHMRVLPDEFTGKLNKELLPKFHHVSKILSVEELKEFATSLVSLAEEYDVKPLKEYGQKLLKQTDPLHVEKIMKILPEFEEIAKIIIY